MKLGIELIPEKLNTKVLKGQMAFVRLDLQKDFSIIEKLPKDCIPTLYLAAHNFSSLIKQENFIEEAIFHHLQWAKALKNAGFNRLVLAADDDGFWIRLCSFKNNCLAIEERCHGLLQCFSALKNEIDELLVQLCVEELSPGGMDATDGIFIAQQLEQLGLKKIIATSGSKDFLPLYLRRPPHQKASQKENFSSHEPEMAAALWLIQATTLEVFSLAKISDWTMAKKLALNLGLSGIINKY